MSATAIILLIGVVSFWVAVAVMSMFLLRFRRTIEDMEKTLGTVQNHLNDLAPTLSDTLKEMEKTGREVGSTASEVRMLAGKVNASGTPAVISGAMNYIPAVAGAIRLLAPLFRRRRQ